MAQILAVTWLKYSLTFTFCSDDKNARNRATNFEDVRCTSLVSAFSRLKEEANWVIDDAEPYIEALVEFYQEHNQVILRVMEPLKVADCSVYHVDRYYGKSLRKKFVELKNGMLRYKQWNKK